jgi:type IV secretory pathway TraG/TraD family ATPase VirD4
MLVAALIVSAGDADKMRDGKFWESNAVRALRCLLAAADIADLDMRAVVRWSALDQGRPIELLERAGPDGWAADLRKLQEDTAENTLSSIVTTIATCLEFMADPVLAHAATPTADEHFEVDEWLRTGGTVHIIGTRRDHSPVGPLFAALAGCLYERAVEVATRSPGGRLDPPVPFVLDEVAKTLRVPLAQWAADAGGFGIPMVIAAQDRHQLRDAFGDNGAAAIWSLASTKVILGGQSDPDLLRDVSELCGTRAVEIGSKARRPIMTPADIRELPPQRALVLTRACPPVIARIPMVWERRNPPVAAPLVSDDATLAEVVRLDDHRRGA